ncbi:MAG: hypothetical protein ACRDV1_03760 [Actinomycetes bacterium]
MTGVPLRLGAYAGALAVAFGAAFGVGAWADPLTTTPADAHGGPTPGQEPHVDDHSTSRAGSSATVAGLAVTEAGYTLEPVSTALPAGADVPFRFEVTGPDGAAVTDYRESHEKELHLIVVRRDLAGFQHVHPTRGADGTWSVQLDLDAAGTYRAFADFVPAALGRKLTLGADLSVAGAFQPRRFPAPAATTVVDGYRVALDGEPVAGREVELGFTVSRGDATVTDLQPYLGAFGHLVSLRAGDLGYLHTHPTETAHAGEQGGPQVRFATTFPTAGAYRLFLDFQHAGTVRTAAFTVTVGSGQRPAR